MDALKLTLSLEKPVCKQKISYCQMKSGSSVISCHQPCRLNRTMYHTAFVDRPRILVTKTVDRIIKMLFDLLKCNNC